MRLNRSSLAVIKVASKDKNQPALNCIHVTENGSTVASDGKVLVAVSPTIAEEPSKSIVGVNIPLEIATKVQKNLPKNKDRPKHVVLISEGDKISLSTDSLIQQEIISGQARASAFMDWKASLRSLKAGTPGEDPGRICVSRGDLIKVLQALDEACPDKEGLVYIELGSGMVLRSRTRDKTQQAVGGIVAHPVPGGWITSSIWEQGVFNVAVKVLKSILRRLPTKLSVF